MDYKRTLRNITIAFFCVLAAFTFFSQTLADLRIPRVSLAFTQSRVVGQEAIAVGIVTAANTETIFTPVGGTIVQLEERGEQVSGTTVLFTIRTEERDFQPLQEQINQAHDELRLIALNRERVQASRALEQQRINQLMEDTPTAPALVEFDLQLANNAHQIETAQRELEERQALFAQGIIPRHQVTEREDTLATLQRAREEILIRQELALEAQAEHITEQIRARNTQIELHQAAIAQFDLQLRVHTAETESVHRRINELTSRMIGGGGYVEIESEGNRTILDFMPGVTVGARISEGAPMMMTALRDNQFTIEVPIGAMQYFVEVGNEAVVEVGTTQITGNVRRIFSDGGRSMAIVEVNDRRLSGGEFAFVTIQGQRSSFTNTVQRSALREDSSGYYLLIVEAEERLFGVSYYARALRLVDVLGRSDRYVAVIARESLDVPIIINSDVPVYVGTRVRPVDGGDFDEIR